MASPSLPSQCRMFQLMQLLRASWSEVVEHRWLSLMWLVHKGKSLSIQTITPYLGCSGMGFTMSIWLSHLGCVRICLFSLPLRTWLNGCTLDNLTYASIKVYLSAIRSLHIDHGLLDPFINSLHLQRLLGQIKRVQCPESPGHLPITLDHLQAIQFSLLHFISLHVKSRILCFSWIVLFILS